MASGMTLYAGVCNRIGDSQASENTRGAQTQWAAKAEEVAAKNVGVDQTQSESGQGPPLWSPRTVERTVQDGCRQDRAVQGARVGSA
jgi:hypothetical protein